MSSNALPIRTPEGIVFSQTLAGPVMRFFAWLIDGLCVMAVMGFLAELIRVFELVSPGMVNAVLTIAFFVLNYGSSIFLEWVWRGQTVGKKLLGLRVVDAEGMRLQFDQVVTRNLLRVIDLLPLAYVVGGLSCWLSKKCQRLGDIAANTIVVRIPVVTEPDLDQLLAGKFNSLRQHSHLAARLRQRVTPAEAAIALQALVRRDEFDAVARLELFDQLASHFQMKVPFPQDAIDGVSAEQYIRNVVDVVYRTSASS
jgi:uncharacterized RDD family membrane protein YckC